jgi:hypothetical protein
MSVINQFFWVFVGNGDQDTVHQMATCPGCTPQPRAVPNIEAAGTLTVELVTEASVVSTISHNSGNTKIYVAKNSACTTDSAEWTYNQLVSDNSWLDGLPAFLVKTESSWTIRQLLAQSQPTV